MLISTLVSDHLVVSLNSITLFYLYFPINAKSPNNINTSLISDFNWFCALRSEVSHAHIAAAIYITVFDLLVKGPCIPVAAYESLGLHTQIGVVVK
jgi:hypothetical protein